MRHGDNDPVVIDRLRGAISKPDSLLLIGSGVSQWAGLPSWSHLIEALAKYRENLGLDSRAVRRSADEDDFLLAASYGVQDLDTQGFGAFIRRVCTPPIAAPTELHELIVGLGPTCFATTNYDRLIEDSVAAFTDWSPRVVTNTQVAELQNIVAANATHFVF